MSALDQELEHVDSRRAPENSASVTATDDATSPDLFEPAPFHSTSKNGRYMFPLPHVRLGAGVNGVVDK